MSGYTRTFELRQLRYFVTVAEELNFRRASQRLRIAGPSLSQQIKALERNLKVQLFERNHRSVALTPAGATLLPQARDLLAQADELRRLAGGFVGTKPVRIGVVNKVPSGWAERISGVAPVVFDTWVLPSHSQASRVSVGNLDLAICHLETAAVHSSSLTAHLAGVEHLHAVCVGTKVAPVNACDAAVLIEADTISWSSWNHYAQEFADSTGASTVKIEDGGLTGNAFFDHVRRLRRPLLNAPKGPTPPLPHDMVQRPVVAPTPLWTWSLVQRCADDRRAVSAVAAALTKGVDAPELQGGRRWLPRNDPHHPG